MASSFDLRLPNICTQHIVSIQVHTHGATGIQAHTHGATGIQANTPMKLLEYRHTPTKLLQYRHTPMKLLEYRHTRTKLLKYRHTPMKLLEYRHTHKHVHKSVTGGCEHEMTVLLGRRWWRMQTDLMVCSILSISTRRSSGLGISSAGNEGTSNKYHSTETTVSNVQCVRICTIRSSNH